MCITIHSYIACKSVCLFLMPFHLYVPLDQLTLPIILSLENDNLVLEIRYIICMHLLLRCEAYYSNLLEAFLFLKIMRDPETGNSRGFGFVSYDSFESSDQAIEVMYYHHNVLFCSFQWFYNLFSTVIIFFSLFRRP